MQIKEHPLWTKYLFNSPLYIDDNMNVSTDTKEFDQFKLLLEQHGIDDYKTTSVVDGKHEIVVAIMIYHEYITKEFEYDLLTMMMQGKLRK